MEKKSGLNKYKVNIGTIGHKDLGKEILGTSIDFYIINLSYLLL